MASLWSSKRAGGDDEAAKNDENEREYTEGNSNSPPEPADDEQQDDDAETTETAPPMSRPLLQRDTQLSAPPQDADSELDPRPPPQRLTASPGELATDSLSLAQLRQIVSQANRAEPLVYDFEYADTGPHAEEIDEWFAYQLWQWMRLNSAQQSFETQWAQKSGAPYGASWDDTDHDTRMRFVQAAIAGVQSADASERSAAIGQIVYLVLGRWGDTAMPNASDGQSRSLASMPQLQAIKAGVECLTSLEGLPVIWDALRSAFEQQWTGDTQQGSAQDTQDELMNLMTIMYITLQETLNDPEDMSSSYRKLLHLKPSLVDYMMLTTSKLRWDEQSVMPQTQILLLFWKSILLVFGGSEDLARVKKATSEVTDDNQNKQTITASPLDYHVFRQEITSKYPAYVPPQPAIPLEAENTSILPPLTNQQPPSRNHHATGILPPPPNAPGGGASILNQPVHIATPAPSPPPSPGAGGKAGKKQNYQTNQNFPFMYPPLDASSNSAGGKGMAALHDPMVTRRWEGSDIPASILEAGELFSTRVRMTRSLRQLWDERERFLKNERGWDDEDDEEDIPELDLSELSIEEQQIIKAFRTNDRKQQLPPLSREEMIDFGPHPEKLSLRDKQRLASVEDFYREALPHLQSLVIVLLRPIFMSVTALVTSQQNSQGQNGRPNQMGQRVQEEPEPSAEEVDSARTREITAKAMSGILVLLLKWLRLSHILKFEYMTQLLLDSNYVPLVLKLFAHQDVQQVVDSKMERPENSFFQFCNMRSKFKEGVDSDNEDDDEQDDEPEEKKASEAAANADDEESEDDAAPPPIKRRRSPPADADEEMPDADAEEGLGQPNGAQARPEVDELGYPLTAHPMEPITDFSWRNFFSLINCLRVMQKVCKNKAHRNLLLVQYKSSTILRKSLRVPQTELRLYTLKLFKNQVPYCGRKWRQSNMRVITAVYLHCRPELRDEWLAGSDIDAEVDSALPLEQALRGLTHWLNTRRYPDKVAGEEVRAALKVEHDFFTRELEKIDLDWDFGVDDMSDAESMDGWWPLRGDV